jgi:hypothetical protein
LYVVAPSKLHSVMSAAPVITPAAIPNAARGTLVV